MSPFRRLKFFARRLFGHRDLNTETNEEIRAHLEAETLANIQAGMSPEAARREAHRSFGTVDSVKERVRDEHAASVFEDAWRDAVIGARLLRKSPGFTIVAIA